MMIDQMAAAAWRELVRLVTGRLFSEDQIRTITSNAVGRYLADFFPEPKSDEELRNRVDEAREHIRSAGAIVTQLHGELHERSSELDSLLVEIERKKATAER